MRLLGLDPGLRVTGWGVIDVADGRLRWIADGVLRTDPTGSLAERLAQLHRDLSLVIAEQHPDEAAVEDTFLNRNVASALKLGQARGALILTAAMAGLPVAEYAPRLVKQAVVGTGRAEKEQVAAMIRRLLPGCAANQADAADALAVAVCHAHHRMTARRLAASLEARA